MHLTGDAHTPLLVILGPTAIGKTQLAIDIAQSLNGEIIGADSRQIYQYMDIGTAKPSPEQRAVVTHHLVDFIAPDADYSLADYQEQAYAHAAAITTAGKLPILCGGTGQYITAFVEGWSIPRVEPNEDLRQQLEAEAAAEGRALLHQRLALVDPAAAEKIHPNDARRVIRALEVYHQTGKPISVLQRKKPPRYRIHTIGLRMTRDALYARADERVDMMMTAGFIDEVQALLALGFAPDLPAMSALGYRELCDYLLDELSLEDAIERTKLSTHDFIRRQEIWFRGHDHDTQWVCADALNVPALITDLEQWLEEA